MVENGTIIWSPHCLQDTNIIENVQKQFTEVFTGIFNFSNVARLERLKVKF